MSSRAARQVRILTQENGGGDVIMELQIATNDAADQGVQMNWHIDAIQPAMSPRMGAGIVLGVLVFSVMIHGRDGDSVADKVVNAIGNGSKTAPEAGYATAWTEEDYRHCGDETDTQRGHTCRDRRDQAGDC